MVFLSTLSLRRATVKLFRQNYECFISIHALLAESDVTVLGIQHKVGISIHALLAESDLPGPRLYRSQGPFLSTLSLRRATSKSAIVDLLTWKFLSPLSLRRATHTGSSWAAWLPFLSTLSLRRATSVHRTIDTASKFLSTLSLRRATIRPYANLANPGFLSTLSLRRATPTFSTPKAREVISIHALLAESDSKSAQNSGALLRIWNKFYGDFIFMLTGKAVFYPFCPCFFHIFWCEGTGNFMIAFPSH